MPDKGKFTLEEMRTHFAHIDTDGNGKIDFDEFVALLKTVGFTRQEDIIRLAFDAIDADRSGYIDFDVFGVWWDHVDSDRFDTVRD